MQWLPVSSYGLGLGLVNPHANMPYALRMGLWVGTVQVDSVCETNNIEDRETPKAVASSFNFPLIIHVDDQSKLHLLSEAYVVKKPAVTGPDPDNPGQTKIVEPARLVLLTDRTKIAQYQNAAGSDLISRRFCLGGFWRLPAGRHAIRRLSPFPQFHAIPGGTCSRNPFNLAYSDQRHRPSTTMIR